MNSWFTQVGHCQPAEAFTNDKLPFTGTAHGFACRPNFAYPDVKEAYEKALKSTILFFKKTL